MVIVIDGAVVDVASATVSVLDRGLLYGDGLFEVLRTWNGRAVDLDAHLDRLEDSARWLKLPIDRVSIVRDVERVLEAAGAGDHRIRVVVTRGPGSLAVPMASAGPGRTIVIAEPLGELPETTSLAIVDWPLPRRAGRGHKTLAYLDHLVAREMARDAGADDAIRLDADGKIAEGGTCNVFAVIGGVVFAPSDGFAATEGFAPDGSDDLAERSGVLPGVTAARVAGICRRIDIPMVVGPIALEAFLTADEVFVTSSVRGVVAVTRIVSDDERALPFGQVTTRIRAAHVGEMTALI
ncbi:MAG: aminotransferase class IV [Kofleriaceae bacterium]